MTYKINQTKHHIGIQGTVADADLANSEANIHLDTTSKDIKIKYKDDTGTVRTILIGESSSFATNEVLFGDTDGSITSDPEFYWDNTKKTLGIGAPAGTVAALAIFSTTRGSIPAPRMTQAQRDALPSPATGLQVFNTDTNTYDYYSGTLWVSLGNEATTLVNTTMSGPYASPVNVSYRIGFISDTQVAISFSEVTGAATTSNTIGLDTQIDAAFRPISDKTGVIKVFDNGANMVGEVLLTSTGSLLVASTVDNEPFIGSGTTGFKSFTLVYDVAL